MEITNPSAYISPVTQTSPQGKGQQQGNQPPVTQGQLVKALVVEVKADNRFVLDIGGNRTPAKANVPLSVGQTLQLEVVKTAPQLELRIVSDTLNQFIGRSLTLVGKSIDLSQLMKGMLQQSPPALDLLTTGSKTLLESFSTLQQTLLSGQDGGNVLKELMGGLGLNLEQLLAKGDTGRAGQTLKAALLEVVQQFSAREGFAETAGRILTTLELFQVTQLHIANDNLLIFPLPLPFIEQGYLLIEDQGNAEDEGNQSGENRFSLHLTMTELGNMRVDFLTAKETLRIRFQLEDEERAKFMEQFSEQLLKGISHTGQVSVTFSTGATDPAMELVKLLVPKDRPLLDTRA